VHDFSIESRPDPGGVSLSGKMDSGQSFLNRRLSRPHPPTASASISSSAFVASSLGTGSAIPCKEEEASLLSWMARPV